MAGSNFQVLTASIAFSSSPRPRLRATRISRGRPRALPPATARTFPDISPYGLLPSTQDQADKQTGAILYAGEKATQLTLDAIQLLGGNGYINDYPTGRLLRDAKLYEIGAGTSEIRRWLIGRELFEEKNDFARTRLLR